MSIINIRRFLVRTFLQVSIPFIIFIEGHCKYGDRCTFAHGDQDMRAKFVKAEHLYSTPAQPQVHDPTQIQAPAQTPISATYGTVDYSAFSQPPTMQVPVPQIEAPEVIEEVKASDPTDYGSDFQIPTFNPENFQDGADSPSVFPSFEYKDNGIIQDPTNSLLTSSTSNGVSTHAPGGSGMSKFSFAQNNYI